MNTVADNAAGDDDYGWHSDGIVAATSEGAKWADLKWRPPDQCDSPPEEELEYLAGLSADVFYLMVVHRDLPLWRATYQQAFISAFKRQREALVREREQLRK